MKYRIEQDGDRFYPQYRCFIFWCNFTTNHFNDLFDVCKPSLEEAQEFLHREIEYKKSEKNRTKKIHPFK